MPQAEPHVYIVAVVTSVTSKPTISAYLTDPIQTPVLVPVVYLYAKGLASERVEVEGLGPRRSNSLL